MNWNRAICLGLLASMAVAFSGCATLFSDRKYAVTMDNSGGATYFSVYDSKHQVVESGVTPKQVTLDAKSGLLRRGKYDVVFASVDGVNQQALHAKLDWWTAGNIILGGVPGMAIDALSGAMWKLDSRVTGQVPVQKLVSNSTQGAAVIASHSGKSSSAGGHSIAQQTAASNIQQASFGN